MWCVQRRDRFNKNTHTHTKLTQILSENHKSFIRKFTKQFVIHLYCIVCKNPNFFPKFAKQFVTFDLLKGHSLKTKLWHQLIESACKRTFFNKKTIIQQFYEWSILLLLRISFVKNQTSFRKLQCIL